MFFEIPTVYGNSNTLNDRPSLSSSGDVCFLDDRRDPTYIDVVSVYAPRFSGRSLLTSKMYCTERSSAINLSRFFSGRRTPLRVIQNPSSPLELARFDSNSMIFFRGFNLLCVTNLKCTLGRTSSSHVHSGCAVPCHGDLDFSSFPGRSRNRLTTSYSRP